MRFRLARVEARRRATGIGRRRAPGGGGLRPRAAGCDDPRVAAFAGRLAPAWLRSAEELLRANVVTASASERWPRRSACIPPISPASSRPTTASRSGSTEGASGWRGRRPRSPAVTRPSPRSRRGPASLTRATSRASSSAMWASRPPATERRRSETSAARSKLRKARTRPLARRDAVCRDPTRRSLHARAQSPGARALPACSQSRSHLPRPVGPVQSATGGIHWTIPLPNPFGVEVRNQPLAFNARKDADGQVTGHLPFTRSSRASPSTSASTSPA